MDLFATRLNHQLVNYASWRPDPFAQATDAFRPSWKGLNGYGFPPFGLVGKCLQKIRQEQSTITMVVPQWHSQVWYPTLMECLVDYPLILPKRVDLLRSPSNQLHPLIIQGSLKLLACRVYTATGVSEKASELLLAGWSAGTNAAYQLGWARWNRWCGERARLCSIQPFLADLYHAQGLQYRSINLIHSAVSMTHKNIEAAPIGQHPSVSRLMRGIYNSRPPIPQYCNTWDMAAVLSWIKRPR